MGQKVRPTGFRTGIFVPWLSQWYASKADFSDLLVEDAKIRRFIKKKHASGGVSKIRIERTREKVVVFTQFRRTLEALHGILTGHGFDAAIYHGSLTRMEKDAAITCFAGDAPVLLSTEAAGEGRNLQFCHVMVNFDLPWNPMQIEQRLGRIHRIGQQHDVQLTNLVSHGTLEEHLIEVLQAKINLFELVVGELDMILGRLANKLDFESLVFEQYIASRDDNEFAARLERVGDDLASARVAYLGTRERIDELVAAG